MIHTCPPDLKSFNLFIYSRQCFIFFLLIHQVSSYAIRDAEEYKNFCDRPKDQRPLPEEVIGVSHCFS